MWSILLPALLSFNCVWYVEATDLSYLKPIPSTITAVHEQSPTLLNREDGNTETYSTNASTHEKSAFYTSINQQLPAGSLVMITPVTTASTFVKVGSNATFSWTYTNLLVTPEAFNVELQCSTNLRTYTLATSLPFDQHSFIWNTSDTDQDPKGRLVNAKYVLIVYDSNSSASAAGSAGYLAPYQYLFGVFRPQAYTNWAGNDLYINSASQIKLSVFALLTGIAAVLSL